MVFKNNPMKRLWFTLKQILDDLGIRRQSFYDMNKKHKYFYKMSRGRYTCGEDIYIELKHYYGMKLQRLKRGSGNMKPGTDKNW